MYSASFTVSKVPLVSALSSLLVKWQTQHSCQYYHRLNLGLLNLRYYRSALHSQRVLNLQAWQLPRFDERSQRGDAKQQESISQEGKASGPVEQYLSSSEACGALCAAGVNKVSGSQAVEQLLHQPHDGRQVAHRGPSQSVQCCRHSDLGQPIVSISTANVQVSYPIYILLVKQCCPGTFVTGLSYDRTRCTDSTNVLKYRFKRVLSDFYTGFNRFRGKLCYCNLTGYKSILAIFDVWSISDRQRRQYRQVPFVLHFHLPFTFTMCFLLTGYWKSWAPFRSKTSANGISQYRSHSPYTYHSHADE